MQWHDLGMSNDRPRLWHTATSFNDGEVIIFGGCHGDILSQYETPVCVSFFCILYIFLITVVVISGFI